MDQTTKFWLKVKRPGPDECWEWQGGKDHGYGVFTLGSRTAGRVRAHRHAWALVKGPIPEGKDVLHTCDNPPCVNPKHLYLGTDVENARDRKERGGVRNNFPIAVAKRTAGWNRKTRPDDRRGWNTPVKLTDDQVQEIRRRKAPGVSNKQLGEEFGVTHVTIGYVLNRKGRYAGIE